MRVLFVLALAYFPGFITVLGLHIALLPMVTISLAMVRAVVWPIWIIAGWPHGVPLPMD